MLHLRESIKHCYYLHPSIKTCIKVLTCPLCFVCYGLKKFSEGMKCYSSKDRKRRERHGALSSIAQRRRERALKSRKRSLSSDRSKRGKKVVAQGQSQSPFFSKFPAELRIKIYEMVLCGTGRLHIRFRPSVDGHDAMNLMSYSCLAENEHDVDHGDCHSGIWERHYKQEQRISLLQTCRRAYHEAIIFLYSAPTFNFHCNEEFKIFSRSVLPQRLKQIRYVAIEQRHEVYMDNSPIYYVDREFSCEPYDPNLFTILSNMDSLQRVYLEYQSRPGEKPSRLHDTRTVAERTLIRADGGWVPLPTAGEPLRLQRMTSHELSTFVYER